MASNAQEWVQTATIQTSNTNLNILHVDIENNAYGEISYGDSIFIGDTSFIHSNHYYFDNIAIPISTESRVLI